MSGSSTSSGSIQQRIAANPKVQHLLAVESGIGKKTGTGTARHLKHTPIVSATQNGHTFNVTTLNPSSNVSGSGVLTTGSVVLDVDPAEKTPKQIVHYQGEAYENNGAMGAQAVDTATQLLKFYNGNNTNLKSSDVAEGITEATNYKPTTTTSTEINYFKSNGTKYVMVSQTLSGLTDENAVTSGFNALV